MAGNDYRLLGQRKQLRVDGSDEHRPIAAGQMRVGFAFGLGVALAVAGLAGAFAINLLLGVLALAVRSGPAGEPTVGGAFLTTAHQANGALLMAVVVALLVWVWGLKRGEATGYANENVARVGGAVA